MLEHGLGIINPLVMGILLGGLYALNGLSLSLVFGVMKLINVAHGDLLILASYFSYFLLTSFGVDPLISLVAGAPLFFMLGYAIQRFMLNRVFKVNEEAPLLITIGLSIIVENAIRIKFSALPRSLVTPYSLVKVSLGSISFPLVYLLGFVASLILMLILREIIRKTYLGLAIRAASQNWRIAEYLGVNTDQVYAYTFGISLTVAAFAGTLLGLTFPFTPTLGGQYLIIAFFVLVIGGLGNMLGTFLVGIMFGVLQTVGGHLLGVNYLQFIIYLLLFIMLAVRPQGFFRS